MGGLKRGDFCGMYPAHERLGCESSNAVEIVDIRISRGAIARVVVGATGRSAASFVPRRSGRQFFPVSRMEVRTQLHPQRLSPQPRHESPNEMNADVSNFASVRNVAYRENKRAVGKRLSLRSNFLGTTGRESGGKKSQLMILARPRDPDRFHFRPPSLYCPVREALVLGFLAVQPFRTASASEGSPDR